MKAKLIFTYLFIQLFILNFHAKAEEFDVQLTPSLYAGGYNISCNGASNGSINLFISGGNAPYTFVWLDGPVVRNRSNLAAGYYRVVVTASNGLTVTREITLVQPNLFQVQLDPSVYEGGYNLSENGGNNGIIVAEVTGGVPPYTYLWSNGSTSGDRISELTAGQYSLTVHDATNCISTASVTLIEPTVFQLVSITSPIVVGSYNIGCNLAGSINVNVSGGTPPYQYEWGHGPSTQNVNDISESGDYSVLIRDHNGAEVRAFITLSRAPEVIATATAFVFPNNKNTSCNTCTNGSISLNITSGTAPYIYVWNNGLSIQNPSNLGAGMYSVVITDAAGCTLEKTAILIAPEREDWSLNGNMAISSSQFIGTSDNSSLPFKANNIEIFKLVPDTLLNGLNSYTKFSKLISAESGISLDASRTIKISYESNVSGNSLYYGDNKSFNPTCASPSYTGIKHVFPGSLVAWTPVAGSSTIKAGIVIGAEPWNGTGTIELQGTNELGAETNQLNINWYCGKDIGLCSNPLKPGKVSTGRQFEVGFPSTLTGINIAANIRGNEQIGLRVESVSEGVNIPLYNTQFVLDNISTNLLSGKIENTVTGVDKELISIKGNGETKIGDPYKPSLYIAPSYDAVTNSYVSANVRIASLGNTNSDYNLVQADGNGELSKINVGNLLNSTHYWESNNSGVDVFHSTGNVGIGTGNTSPSSLLDIIGVSSSNINTHLKVSQDVEKFLIYDRQTSLGNKNVLSLNGDGQFRIGCDGSTSPGQPTLFITPSLSDEQYVMGNVGIGNSQPKAQLQVGSGVSSISIGSFWSNGLYDTWITNYIGFNAARQKSRTNESGTWNFSSNPSNAGSIIAGDLGGNTLFINLTDDGSGAARNMSDADILKDPITNKSNVKMFIRADGKVGIGTSPTAYFDPATSYNLYVTGGIRTEKVKVDIAGNNGWADYVFEKNYKNMPLHELELYIAKYKHLPHMPSACEAEENGVDLLEMQVKLLKSVEELTLHMIDLKKENDKLKADIEKLKLY